MGPQLECSTRVGRGDRSHVFCLPANAWARQRQRNTHLLSFVVWIDPVDHTARSTSALYVPVNAVALGPEPEAFILTYILYHGLGITLKGPIKSSISLQNDATRLLHTCLSMNRSRNTQCQQITRLCVHSRLSPHLNLHFGSPPFQRFRDKWENKLSPNLCVKWDRKHHRNTSLISPSRGTGLHYPTGRNAQLGSWQYLLPFKAQT